MLVSNLPIPLDSVFDFVAPDGEADNPSNRGKCR
jgi:hypothetical protein